MRLRGGGDGFGTPPMPASPTYSPHETPAQSPTHSPAPDSSEAIVDADFHAAFEQGFPQGFPPDVPPDRRSPTIRAQDMLGSAQASSSGTSSITPAGGPAGRVRKRKCSDPCGHRYNTRAERQVAEVQWAISSVLFSETVAARTYNSLLEMGHEVDEPRLSAFVGSQLCSEPRPWKDVPFYVNKYVGEVLGGALEGGEGREGVVVYGRDPDSDSP